MADVGRVHFGFDWAAGPDCNATVIPSRQFGKNFARIRAMARLVMERYGEDVEVELWQAVMNGGASKAIALSEYPDRAVVRVGSEIVKSIPRPHPQQVAIETQD